MNKTFLFKALNHVVLLNTAGTQEYELDPNDYSKMLNGEPAPQISDTAGDFNVFAKPHKLYIYMYDDSLYEYYYIADYKVNSNYEPIGFQNASRDLDYVYIGTYLGSRYSNKMRSLSGQPIAHKGMDNMSNNTPNDVTLMSYVTANGSNYYSFPLANLTVYEIAFMCMFQTEDATSVVGTGRSGIGGTTGLLNNKGPVACSSGCVKFMHLEDFKGKTHGEIIQGLLLAPKQGSQYPFTYPLYTKMRPPYSHTANPTTSGFTLANQYNIDLYFYAKNSKCSNQIGRIPVVGGGSEATYQCAYFGNPNADFSRYIYFTRESISRNICDRLAHNFSFDTQTGISPCTRLTYIPA